MAHDGPTWWSDVWAWRAAIAAAPFGALAAILHALFVERAEPSEALLDYAVGGMAAAGIACLLGGSLGAFGVGLAKRRRAPVEDDEEPAPAVDEPGHAAVA